MARRPSSASKAPAPAPLTSRTNDNRVTPAKIRRKPTGIPRNPFRRLSKSRNSPGSDAAAASSISSAEAGRQSHTNVDIVDDDEGDVQYIDLDHVVMASRGEGKATSADLIEVKGPTDPSGRRPDEEEEGSLVRCGDDERLTSFSNDDVTGTFLTDNCSSFEGSTLERSSESGDSAAPEAYPSSPPRSRDEASGEPSSPPLSPSPAAYHLPKSLCKRWRRSPRRRIPLRVERSPSPTIDGSEEIEWAQVRALETKQHQVVAYWNLLYPHQPLTANQLTSFDEGTTLKSCLKRARRESDDGGSVAPPKVLQWGSNSAVEFTGEMSAMDFHHLSPATVELQFPNALERYRELHPVDEAMMQITKDNSAILAAWEGLNDDSSSESSEDSDEDNHCFEDDDDDGDDGTYRLPRRQRSSALKIRRESGIFTPAPLLDASTDDPLPPPSPAELPPLDKLTVTSPLDVSSPPHKVCEEQSPDQRESSTGISPSVLSVHPIETESVETAPAPLLVPTNGLKSVGPTSGLTWQQKLFQVCLSPVSSLVGIDPGHSLETIVSKLAHLDRNEYQGLEETIAFPALEGLGWVEPFNSSMSLRMLVDRSFLLARGALALLPPAHHVACYDDDIEALAQAEWLEVEMKVLEAMVFQLATGHVRDLSIECGGQAEEIVSRGTTSWIRTRAIHEEQELARREAELRSLECQHECLKQLQVQTELSAVVWGRYNTHLLQAVSPFTLVDTDGVESRLAFPTPVQGYDIAAIHEMDESLIIDTENNHGPSSESTGIDTRFDPLHPCSQFYVPLVDACIRNLSQISTEGGMGSLLTLELLLGRLESAFWDVQQFCGEAGNATVESYDHDGATIVVVSARTAANAMLHFFYDCSDVRTLYSCTPTLAQLDVENAPNALSQSYPLESLSRVSKSLLEELETQESLVGSA